MYREFRPDPKLRPFLECGWLRSGSTTRSIRVIPDGCVDIYVTAEGELMIAGPADTFFDVPAENHDVLAGLRLRPGAAAAVIGCPASEFTNLRVPLDRAFGATNSRTGARILGTARPRERIAILANAIRDYFAETEPALDRPVTQAVSMLRVQPDRPISTLAADLGLSERQLRRRFQIAVGYGPKRLGRVFRFQRLLDLVYAPHGRDSWSQLALAAGYADQPHMINECLALTGGPPTTLRSQIVP